MSRFSAFISGLGLALIAASIAPVSFANLGEEDSETSTNADFLEGKKAIEAQDWKKATAALKKAVAAEPKNADAHNFLGYALRKDGDVDRALDAYDQALKLNPRHKAAHEYMGEAYLMVGDVTKAEKHLEELRKLCSPIPCEEYKDLNKAIAAYKKAKK